MAPLPLSRAPLDAGAGGWNALDGFSPLVAGLRFAPGVDLDRSPLLPRLWNVANSLDPACPTVLLDTVTGRRVPHWVELDHRSDQELPGGYNRTLMLWPAQSLEFGRRYVWAYSGLVDSGGAALPASPAFAALRDGTPSPEPSVNARRQHYRDEVFAPLARAGVPVPGLQLAWDFTVATQEGTQERLLSARDDALGRVPPDKGYFGFNVTKVQDNYSADTLRRVEGTFEVPLYLETAEPGQRARLVLGAGGEPAYQGMASARFIVMIPRSAAGADGRGLGASTLAQYGHGLFGSAEEVDEAYLQAEANRRSRVMVGVDWWGLSKYDVVPVVQMLLTNATNFGIVPDRLLQGVVNHHVVMPTVLFGLARDASMLVGGAPVLPPPDRARSHYFGNSLGGIMGTVYVATSGSRAAPMPGNVTRGCLGVNGGPFSLLLPRSVDFSALWSLISALVYPDPQDKIALLNLFQELWSRAGPGGWMSSAGATPPRGTQPHTVMQHYGVGDAQVTYLGAYSIGRSVPGLMFASNVREANQTTFGFDTVPDDANVTGSSVIQGYSFAGVPPVPQRNVPPNKTEDTHECVRRAPQAQDQMALFFETGVIHNFCGGACAGLPCPKRLAEEPWWWGKARSFAAGLFSRR